MATLPSAQTYAVAEALGLLACALASGRRSAAARNFACLLGLPLSASRVHRLVRLAFRHYSRMSLDFFLLTALSDERLLARAVITGRQHLDEALARGHGAVLALPHLGNWDLAARICVGLGYPLTAVVESDWSAAFAEQARAGAGVRVVARERSLRPLLRALARNEPVALIADVVPAGGRGVEVSFAGQRAMLPAGPARLAIHAGAPIIPCAAVALRGGRIELAATSAIYGPEPGHAGPAVEALTQMMAAEFERLILRRPEQWYAFRPLTSQDHAA